MTGSEYFDNLQKQLSQENLNKAILASAITVHANMSDRIFVEGKSTDNSEIGKYNTTDPLYVNPKKSPNKFPTQGKPNKAGNASSVFKSTGNPHTTGYFESYAKFRKEQGRSATTVNLTLFGILQSNFVNGLKPSANGAVVGLSEKNALIAEGQETHWKKRIFAHSKEELEKYYMLVDKQFKSYAK